MRPSEQAAPVRRAVVAATLLLGVGVVSTTQACGGRSFELAPFDPDGSDGASGDGSGGSTDGSGGAGATGANAATGAGSGVGGGTGGVGNGGVGGSSGSGNPVDCLTCAGFECPALIECLTDPVCAQGTFCAISDCLGGGGQPDPICFLDCFGGDPDAAFAAFDALSCVFTQCGDECADLLGGDFPGL